MSLKVRQLILIAIIFAVSSVPLHSANSFEGLIIGKWGNSDDGGKTFWGFDEYFNNGTILSTGIDQYTYGDYVIESTFEIKNEKSCFTVTKSSDPRGVAVGHKRCDKIVLINDKHFKFERDGEIITLYRVSNSTKLIGDVPNEKADDIEKLLELSGAFESMNALMSNLGVQIASNLARSKPEIPERVLEKVKNEINNIVQKEVNNEGGLTLRLIRIYHKYYTHSEIKEIISFYNSPIGKKLAESTVQITKESELVGASWAESIQPLLLDRLFFVLQQEGYDFK